tara:strand:- start:576 stop:983 length:408 start_codon:yes stop_codon:yes gene_type:complete
MTDPRKKLRQTLHSIYKLKYRIRKNTPSKEVMEKKIFIDVLHQLKTIEERKDFMAEEIGMDMTAYEDQFFAVIENLLRLHYNKEQLALIQMYLYQLVPDKDWDGTITIEKGKVEKVVPFKRPEDVWKVIETFQPK